MTDPQLKINIDGEEVPVAELVELKRNLRWRRWPEEKPEAGQPLWILQGHWKENWPQSYTITGVEFTGIEHNGIGIAQNIDWRGGGSELFPTSEDHAYGDNAWEFWLPLSALPKPEGEK